MLCRAVIGFRLKKLTVRKFYGTYLQNITSHASIQNRLINGRSANTEEQERIFNAITNITCTTSSFHSDHIISNILVRLQAEKDLAAGHAASSVQKQQDHVSKLASSLPKLPNTVIPKAMLVKHPSSWQAHLERISDFLLVGKGFWWDESENGDIHFMDAKGNPESMEKGPLLHHFRSSTFKSEETYLKKCWLKCLEQKPNLPILRLQIEDENGNMVSVDTSADHIPNDEQMNAAKDKNEMVKCVVDEGDSGNLVGDDAVRDELIMPGVVSCGAVAMCVETNCAEGIGCEDGGHVVNAGGHNIGSDNLGDRDVSFHNILLDDCIDQAGVTKQDLVNIAKCNPKKSCNRC